MADDPRVEAAARAAFPEGERSQIGTVLAFREAFTKGWDAALAAADEVQAAEVERLRGERDEALSLDPKTPSEPIDDLVEIALAWADWLEAKNAEVTTTDTTPEGD